MARLEGKNPNVGAIITSAIIFALVAGGLFFAFVPVPEPTDAGITNSVAPDVEQNSAESSGSANATNSENTLVTILTPLPTATEAPIVPTDSLANSAASNTADTAMNVAPATETANEAAAPLIR